MKTENKGVNKPNKKLYFFLFALSLIFFIPAFIVMCFNLYNSEIITITSAIISVSGGFVASVVVAWLIDVANCRKKNEEQEALAIRIFSDFCETFNELLQSFADTCFWYDEDNTNEILPWDEWVDLLFNYGSQDNSKDFKELFSFVTSSLDRLKASIEKLNESKFLLFRDKLLIPDDLKKINRLNLICWFGKSWLKNEDPCVFEKTKYMFIVDIKKAIDEIPLLSMYKDKEYSATNFS